MIVRLKTSYIIIVFQLRSPKNHMKRGKNIPKEIKQPKYLNATNSAKMEAITIRTLRNSKLLKSILLSGISFEKVFHTASKIPIPSSRIERKFGHDAELVYPSKLFFPYICPKRRNVIATTQIAALKI